MFALLLSGCGAPDQSPRETMAALTDRMNEAGAIIPPGAYAYFSDVKQLVVFLAPAESGGSMYLLAAVVDAENVYLMDAGKQFAEWGISGKIAMQELVACLKARGFHELQAGTTPTLIATLRLAWGYLRSQGARVAATGGNAIQLIVVPAAIMTPAWCLQNPDLCDAGPQQ